MMRNVGIAVIFQPKSLTQQTAINLTLVVKITTMITYQIMKLIQRRR